MVYHKFEHMHERSVNMSSRIKRYARRLSGNRTYIPEGLNKKDSQKVHVKLDEFEALRLVDYENLSQIEASEEMQVSRATIQRLLTSGRKKIVEAILSNQIIEVQNEIDNIRLKGENKYDIASKDTKIIAFPTNDKVMIDAHFGRAKTFTLYTITNDEIVNISHLTPPPHAPGVIPAFLQENNVDVVITRNMGQKAVQLFANKQIDIILGAEGNIEENLKEYLKGLLSSSKKPCNGKEKS